MSTNYYLFTKNKSIADKIGDFELTDTPDWGYLIHIGKRSCGWLPLFERHNGIKSVKDIEKYCTREDITILDEYDKSLTWVQLKKELIDWNGGVAGKIPKKYHIATSPLDDPDMPDYTPISHFDYGHGKYSSDYFKDREGYEFTYHKFC